MATVSLIGHYENLTYQVINYDVVIGFGFVSFTVIPRDGSPPSELSVKTVITFTRNKKYCSNNPLSRKWLITEEWLVFL
jgi:hypothetical protein